MGGTMVDGVIVKHAKGACESCGGVRPGADTDSAYVGSGRFCNTACQATFAANVKHQKEAIINSLCASTLHQSRDRQGF